MATDGATDGILRLSLDPRRDLNRAKLLVQELLKSGPRTREEAGLMLRNWCEATVLEQALSELIQGGSISETEPAPEPNPGGASSNTEPPPSEPTPSQEP